jgi:hypothetical protein
MPYGDVAPFAASLVAANPDRVLRGGGWPHTDSTRCPGLAPTDISPFPTVDDRAVLNQLPHWVADAVLRQKILVANPPVSMVSDAGQRLAGHGFLQYRDGHKPNAPRYGALICLFRNSRNGATKGCVSC